MRLVALITLLAAGCGGDGDDLAAIEGDFQVTTVEEDPTGCGNLAPGTVDPSTEYFRLAEEDFFGTRILGYYSCTAPGECSDTSQLFNSFTERDGAWINEVASTIGDPMRCEIAMFFETLVELDDQTIEIHRIDRSGEIVQFPDGCPDDFDEVEPYYDDLPCVAERVTTATRL